MKFKNYLKEISGFEPDIKKWTPKMFDKRIKELKNNLKNIKAGVDIDKEFSIFHKDIENKLRKFRGTQKYKDKKIKTIEQQIKNLEKHLKEK